MDRSKQRHVDKIINPRKQGNGEKLQTDLIISKTCGFYLYVDMIK